MHLQHDYIKKPPQRHATQTAYNMSRKIILKADVQ